MDVRKQLFIILVASLVFITSCGQKSATPESKIIVPKAQCADSAIADRYLVKWKSGAVSALAYKSRSELIREVIEPKLDEIDFVENDYIIRLWDDPAMTPTDDWSAAADQNWGQKMIQAPDVWSRGIEGSGVIVAVIDSGVDLRHPQLQGQLAINGREILNGIDDDANGLIDDIHGYDFALDSPLVGDTNGHGTHVAGIILADHGAGNVRGMAPKAKLLPLDFMDNNAGSISDAINAIQYAAAQGARVINASWGGDGCSMALRETIADLEVKGVLFVAAAGNSSLDIDWVPQYPAAFNLRAQITVGASTNRDYFAGFSNYGYERVHLLAPGAGIFSTYPGASVATLSGTSMAAPFVSGAAALLIGHRPRASVAQIKEALLSAVDIGNYPVQSTGRLNVQKAIMAIERLVP